ncbi:MAG: hypothetical protein ACREIP_02005 [Alphaproteobacteria bacterium]
MNRQFLFVMIVGLSMINGIASPFLSIAVPIATVLMPEMFPRSVHWVFFFSSILVASATLLGSGVPAALYERLWDGEQITDVPMYIWFACAVLASLPAIRNLGVV